MPVSTRSLRGSRSTSKAGSPAKRRAVSPTKGGSDSKSGSPLKGGKKELMIEDLILNIPSTIVNLLGRLGVPTMEAMRKASQEELLKQAMEIGSSKPLEADIVKAWIRCLHARAQDPSTKLVSWQDWLESKVKAREGTDDGKKQDKGKAQSSDLGEAARLIITRRELVKQRQVLKKRAPPSNKHITFTDLRVAKARLTHVPTGKALKDKVKPEALTQALSKLKRTGSDLA